MRALLGAALAVLLALGCARPKSAQIQPGAFYGVYKGDRKVMIIRNAPGHLASVGLPPAGQEPVMHPWLTADSLDAQNESPIRDVLDRSKNFEQFVRGLEKERYVVKPE